MRCISLIIQSMCQACVIHVCFIGKAYPLTHGSHMVDTRFVHDSHKLIRLKNKKVSQELVGVTNSALQMRDSDEQVPNLLVKVRIYEVQVRNPERQMLHFLLQIRHLCIKVGQQRSQSRQRRSRIAHLRRRVTHLRRQMTHLNE